MGLDRLADPLVVLVRGDADLLRPLRELLRVDRDQGDAVVATIADDNGLLDDRQELDLPLDLGRGDVLAA